MARSKRLVHCAECGRNRLHKAHGLCGQCYRRQRYEANREHAQELGRQWNEANREHKRETDRQWYEANRKHKQCYDRQWYKVHWEEVCERSCQWRKANPDKCREGTQRYRARKANATIGPVDRQAIFECGGYMCMYCGALHVPLTTDHIIALDNGGPHGEDNLVAACQSCNSSKHTSPLEEWLQTQPYSIVWLL